ncbi:MAG TPA: tetratricopeptide repeat protein [Urbifossiella sp.]|nr:tetratricopeptide repeat protein [Urbifossiella sp.]
MPVRGPVLAALLSLGLTVTAAGQDAPSLLKQAQVAFDARQYKEAAALAEKAAAADPNNYRAPYVAGSAYEELGDEAAAAVRYKEAAARAEKAAAADAKDFTAAYAAGSAYRELRDNLAAVKAFSTALERNPKLADAHDRRGDAYLKLGLFKEAVADFDVYLAANPKDSADHWRRGIALYYTGRFDDGRKQFEHHRSVNPEDVENSVWHYLCNAKASSLKQARADLIPVTKDTRVPMKEILQLFAGKATPADVLAAAEAAKLDGSRQKEARFYANLYVALYHESEGNAAKTKEHLEAAVERYKIGHYMWDVGNAHLETMLKKK